MKLLLDTHVFLWAICHVRPRYACRACEAVLQAPAPDLPVERGHPEHCLHMPHASPAALRA